MIIITIFFINHTKGIEIKIILLNYYWVKKLFFKYIIISAIINKNLKLKDFYRKIRIKFYRN